MMKPTHSSFYSESKKIPIYRPSDHSWEKKKTINQFSGYMLVDYTGHSFFADALGASNVLSFRDAL